jgi:Polysaccharide biosynthesis enzyme WcbI
MMSRPVLLLYGNCQVETIGLILRDLPSVCRAYDIHVSLNYPDPATGAWPSPPEDVIRSCEFLIYQKKPIRPLPAFGEELVERGRGIRVPILCCDAFWPCEAGCKQDPRYLQLPRGRYPYGDPILASLLRGNPDDEAVVNEYLEMDLSELFPMENIVEKWHRLMEKVEEEAAIEVSGFILENWRTKRLFWNSGHPANHLLGQIVRKLLKLTGTPAGESELEPALQAHEKDFMMKPIHPSLVRSLQLTWVSDDELYKHLDDPLATRREWYLRYVAYMRELLAILPEPFADKTTTVGFWNNFASC